MPIERPRRVVRLSNPVYRTGRLYDVVVPQTFRYNIQINMSGQLPPRLITREGRTRMLPDLEGLVAEAICVCYPDARPTHQRRREYLITVAPAEVSDSRGESSDSDL